MRISKILPKFISLKYSLYKKRQRAYQKFASLGKPVIDKFFRNYDWAVSLSLLQQIDLINTTLHPKLVLEIGSGNSTYQFYKNLAQDAQLISIDQSLFYLHKAAEHIPHDERVLYICAPTKNGSINFKSLQEKLSLSKKVNVILIDGPSNSRFTEDSIKMYRNFLSDQTICLIDDTDRLENDEAANKLSKEFSLNRYDYYDFIRTSQRHTILLPKNIEEADLFNQI